MKTRNKLKLAINILFIFVLIVVQTACGSARELNALMIVMGIGMDADPDNPENIKLVSQVVVPDKIGKASSEGESSSTPEGPYYNVVSSEINTFEAVREYTRKITGKLYTAHNQVFVVGRDIAERGIIQYFDFFIRAKETRPTTPILISDTTAQDILSVEPMTDIMPAIYIKKLIEAQVNMSHAKLINVQDYVNTMLSKTTSFVAPMIRVVQEDDVPMLSLEGMAIFKKDKMIGEMNEEETRGLLWVKDWVESGAINVEYKGQSISTEIKSTSTKLSAKIKGDEIIMNVKIVEEGSITTQTGKENIATEEGLKEIGELVKQAIQEEVRMAHRKAVELNADIFGFGDELHKYYPKEWKQLEKEWDTIFPTVTIKLDIETNMSSAGVITDPAAPPQKGEQ